MRENSIPTWITYHYSTQDSYPPEKVRKQERNILCLNRRYFSIVREVLTYVSWVERSIFLEIALKTSLDSKSLFPSAKNVKSNSTIVAKRRIIELSLRWKRIAQQYHVGSRRSVQRRSCDWASGSLVTSGFVETKTSSTQCLSLSIVDHGHLYSEYFCGFKVLIRYHKSTTSVVVQIFY